MKLQTEFELLKSVLKEHSAVLRNGMIMRRERSSVIMRFMNKLNKQTDFKGAQWGFGEVITKNDD